MKTALILTFLHDAVLELRLSGVDETSFGFPNVDYETSGRDLFFELVVASDKTTIRTTASTETVLVGAIVLSVPFGEGVERLETITNALVDLFSVYNPRRLAGFKTTEIIYGGAFARKRSFYRVVVASRSVGAVCDGRYKTTVFIETNVKEELI